MNRYNLVPRLIQEVIQDNLKSMPVVIINGSRQTGKSTFVQNLPDLSRQFYNLDDFDVLDSLLNNAKELLNTNSAMTIDEIQLAPNILKDIKIIVDKSRIRGQFLLTGSANLLLLNNISESLAGRASYITLWPLTRREKLQLDPISLWEELLNLPSKDWKSFFESKEQYPDNWQTVVKHGGFPTPCLQLENNSQRAIWFDGYTKTYLERDLRNISSITSLPDFRKLMQLLCLRIGQLLNQTELSRITGIPQATVWRYINLLETSYMLIKLPAYKNNKGRALLKSPKIYWADTGLALNIAQMEPAGFHLENLILNNFISWRDASLNQASIYYWKTASGQEVDFIIEHKDQLIPIEIKASNLPTFKDIKNIHTFQDMYPKAKHGLLLHTGQNIEWISPKVLALPWWHLI